MAPAEIHQPSYSPRARRAALIDPRFEQVNEVATGFMGTVYKAWDRRSGAPVALKLLDERLRDDSRARDRFDREAMSLAELRHPNIVGYVAHGVTPDGQPWLAMDWLVGEDLSQRLLRGPLGVQEALQLARAATTGLAWAHSRGFIHRDLKPGNVFVPGGDPRHATLLDFGLARVAGGADAITRTGTLMGTLEYMAPEQAVDAKRVDARADVFSLGIVLYQSLTGRSPFEGESMHEVLARVVGLDVPPVGDLCAGVPRRFEELIERMMKKDPRDRPRDAIEVLEALGEIDGVLSFMPRRRRGPARRGVTGSATFAAATAVMSDRPTPVWAANTEVIDTVRPSDLPPQSVKRPRRSRVLRNVVAAALALATFGLGFGMTWRAADPSLLQRLADIRSAVGAEKREIFRHFSAED